MTGRHGREGFSELQLMLMLLLRLHDIVNILTGSTLDQTSELADAAPHRHRERDDRHPPAAMQ